MAPDSRLARLMAVLLEVVNARLITPFPVTRDVISTVVHTPVPNDPDEPAALPIGGALV